MDAAYQAPFQALSAYALSAAQLTPLEGGLINKTFRVDAREGTFVLQGLHPIFKAELHEDIEAVTQHLKRKGLATPELVRTKTGALYVRLADETVWRVTTFLASRSFQRLDGPLLAASAGALVGRFHLAVSDLQHEFRFQRLGVHDTDKHFATLRAALGELRPHRYYDRIAPVAERILQHATALPPLDSSRKRVAHGDLKISNLLFDTRRDEGLCLIDLDTLGRMPLSHELGDAWRSWCNPLGEDEPASRFDLELFSASAAAYLAVNPVSSEERAQLVLGVATIALELSARFCADALRESYFGWNAGKFADRSTHNLVRAQSQLAVFESVQAQRSAAEAVTHRA